MEERLSTFSLAAVTGRSMVLSLVEQMGVGGDISWGLPVHNEYRLLAKGIYEYSFYMGPAH
jgi:hypothetical protein